MDSTETYIDSNYNYLKDSLTQEDGYLYRGFFGEPKILPDGSLLCKAHPDPLYIGHGMTTSPTVSFSPDMSVAIDYALGQFESYLKDAERCSLLWEEIEEQVEKVQISGYTLLKVKKDSIKNDSFTNGASEVMFNGDVRIPSGSFQFRHAFEIPEISSTMLMSEKDFTYHDDKEIRMEEEIEKDREESRRKLSGKRMALFPHNQQAYDSIKESFRESDKACVVHATGTGKSFIIEAVAGDYRNVLIVAPNRYVLNEIRKRDIKNATLVTYSALQRRNRFQMDEYDLVILDEFHRAGALKWGAGIEELMIANPQAKMLGTSATEIRYLDKERNMAAELFEGNVVSHISLADAWARGILRVPKYITGLYSFENVDREYRERIDQSQRSDAEKLEMKEMLENGRLDWARSKGIPGILQKHLDSRTKRMVVFCDSIENLDEQKARMKEWLREAGFRSKDYVVHSKKSDSGKEMEEFEKDEFDGIKVMYSVNMLNEGVHVPGVDAVVMLRPTQSKIIYLQQMGRCLSAGESEGPQPVVFDFADNLTSTKEVEQLQREFSEKRIARGEKTPGEIVEVKDFVIEDNIRSLNEVIGIIERKLSSAKSFEERLQDLKDWITENKKWPSNTSDNSAEKSLYFFIQNHNKAVEIQELKSYAESVGVEFSKPKSFTEKIEDLRNWIMENKRWPRLSGNPTEKYFFGFINRHKSTSEIFELKRLAESLGVRFLKSPEQRFSELRTWILEKKRWPSRESSDSVECSLAFCVNTYRDTPEIQELKTLAESLGVKFRKSQEERIEELRDWITENKRWPGKRSKDAKERSLYAFGHAHNDNSKILELREYAKALQYEQKTQKQINQQQDGRYRINLNDGTSLVVDGVSAEKEGFHVVKKDGKFNYVSSEGSILCHHWLDSAGEFKDGIAKCRLGDALLEINRDGIALKKTVLVRKEDNGMKGPR